MNERFKLICFLIYTLVYELIVLGGCGYAVFILGASGWWFVLALILSGSQLKPQHFGLAYIDENGQAIKTESPNLINKIIGIK